MLLEGGSESARTKLDMSILSRLVDSVEVEMRLTIKNLQTQSFEFMQINLFHTSTNLYVLFCKDIRVRTCASNYVAKRKNMGNILKQTVSFRDVFQFSLSTFFW